VNSAVPRSARAGRIRLLVPPSVAAVTLAYHRLPYYPAKTVVRGFAAGLGRVVPLVHVVELLTGPRLSCWHPGETSPTDRLMRAGVHGNERSISISVSISVSIVLRERSGAMMVLGMSPGTSDVMSGVGRVIRISGTRPRNMLSQSLRSDYKLLRTNARTMRTYIFAKYSNFLICSIVGLLEGLRSRHCMVYHDFKYILRLSFNQELTFVITCLTVASTPSNGATGK